MTELQSCASMVNASALCGRNHGLDLLPADRNAGNSGCSLVPLGCEERKSLGCEEREVRRECGIDVVAEIVAELEKERQKNAELMERISMLEAQIQGREKASSPTAEQNGCHSGKFRSFKKFKRQKIETKNDDVEDAEVDNKIEQSTRIKHHIPCIAQGSDTQPDRMVNWMCMDESQFLNFEKHKDGDFVMDCGDTDESDDNKNYDEDETDTDIDDKNGYEDNNSQVANASIEHLMSHGGLDDVKNLQCSEGSAGVKQEIYGDENKGHWLPDAIPCEDSDNITNIRGLKKVNRNERRKHRRQKKTVEMHSSSQGIEHKGSGNLLSCRKPPKVAFCPKEVRRIMESEELLLKNAQSHTMRKILVFASLGIRHGCEDMYELDFNHFKILRKGEPYVSPKDPGEHVLYEYPGVRRKVFYPNRQNQVLCPVQILEEEKSMRPSGPSCPSCLFLCIKYGGRTRNLPQNEYVRQHMGRNKLKSFGPLTCQMALLVHIRSGSFFFKALGITLLFMAGFSDDIVQRETKYRKLDLLQKYYRTDEDAAGQDLFHPYPTLYDTVCPKASSTASKSHGKKQTASISKAPNQQKSTIASSVSPALPPTQFGLMGYASVHTQAVSAYHSHTLTNTSPISNALIAVPNPNISQMGQPPPPYPMFPPYPINPFMPQSVWHNTNAYYPCPYPSSYGYRSIPHSMNYNSHQSQPYYSHPSVYPFMPKTGEVDRKKDDDSDESDSGSSSSATGQNMPLTS